MTFTLKGRTVLITGASSGLGAHLAQVATSAGAQVVLAARRLDRLEALAGALAAQGHKARALSLDVTDEASIAACIAAAGPLDVVVNNAGIAGPQAAVDVSAAAFDRIVDTNLRGCFLVAAAAARSLIAADRGGSIINIASILGMRVAGAVAPYAMSKAGVIQMSKVMAIQHAADHIRVNTVVPGQLHTPMVESRLAGQRAGGDVQALLNQRLARIPLGFMGDGRDSASAALFLASDEARFITGTEIVVDGGMTVRCG
jgi:NAD(P)-dependent dehydrogenase (short-subunit alcohol dehydrogenase family)